MASGLMRAYGQASVEHQYTTLSPGYEKATLVCGSLERRIVIMNFVKDVDEGRRGRSWRADGECKAMGLVIIMIRILADDDHLHLVERCMTGPSIQD